ncbi:MAG: hypothetical protein PW845_27285 [Pseudomonas sp.]|nr:hypothetical protein [Pseudomonas sp. PIA16]MDE1168987.1 hypothetical protein [Pseudomonas sp.]
MHEIPNFPFPSLHEPEQSKPSQSASQATDTKAKSEPDESLRTDRED